MVDPFMKLHYGSYKICAKLRYFIELSSFPFNFYDNLEATNPISSVRR
jgi:hypothetical protein